MVYHSKTPLNMILGLFNVKTRKRPEAWETLYFHLDTEFQSSNYSSKADPKDNMQNLHKGPRAALQSFHSFGGIRDHLFSRFSLYEELTRRNRIERASNKINYAVD